MADNGEDGKSVVSTTECALQAVVMDADTTTGVDDVDADSTSYSVSEE
jgi:hypothetical protein